MIQLQNRHKVSTLSSPHVLQPSPWNERGGTEEYLNDAKCQDLVHFTQKLSVSKPIICIFSKGGNICVPLKYIWYTTSHFTYT